MNSSFRAIAAVGILILAATGCQRGRQPGGAQHAAASKVTSGGDVRKVANNRAKSGATAGRKARASTGGSVAGVGILTLTDDDDGRTFDLRQNQVLTVALPSNRSSGLSWVMVDPTGTVIVRDGGPVYTPKAGKRGFSGTEIWRFRAVRTGRQTVRLEYQRPWQRTVPERTFRFSVVVR